MTAAQELHFESNREAGINSDPLEKDSKTILFRPILLTPNSTEKTYPGTDANITDTLKDLETTRSASLNLHRPNVLLKFPGLSPSKEFFRCVQRWEGYVIKIEEQKIFARLIDLDHKTAPSEAWIYRDEIDNEDADLIVEGAVFYWSIGYLDRPSGRLRSSSIRFRRLPAWSRSELDIARKQAKEMSEFLGW